MLGSFTGRYIQQQQQQPGARLPAPLHVMPPYREAYVVLV
jgi:hypothetical protein